MSRALSVRRLTYALALVIAAPIGSIAAADTRVSLRDGEAPPRGEPLAITSHGVMFADPFIGGSTEGKLAPWHRIAMVEGDLAPKAAAYVEVARLAWRADARLGRGDPSAAEPLFEELLQRYLNDAGPLRDLAAEGLTRCRIARGAHAAAVPSLILWLGGRDASSAPDDGLLDDASGLPRELPPIFLPSSAITAIPLPSVELTDHASNALAWWYAEALRYEGGRPSQGDRPQLDERALGVSLVADIVLARVGDHSERSLARTRLRDRLGRRGLAGLEMAWMRAWAITGIGRSLLLEDDPVLVREGVIDLLTVASTYEGETPRLASIALAEVAVAAHRLGLTREATDLRRELRGRYPGFPALRWPELNSWPDHVTDLTARAAPNPSPLPETLQP
ncbi:MAG: hypothetical protein AAGK04_00915 [Planctomycetota bacterium]